MFVDTHTHLYDPWLLPDAPAAIERALAAGVDRMIQADIDRSERPALWALQERYPGILYPMLGLYPCSVGPDWMEEIDALLPYRDRGIVAIGEIGLDYHEGKEHAALQKEALRTQFELAAAWDLPVNIHLRDAWEDFIAVLKDASHLHLRGNLHCFTGSYEIYEQVNRWGDFRVGIGGVVTFKKASIADTLLRIPVDRILLETDAPYLAPVPHRGQRNESAYLPLVAARVAEIKGLSVEEVAAATTRSAETLFAL